MILRKFTQHMREQNWFAVWLDVCVVITGIFIGLQVTAWNEERQLRVQERQYIMRLEANTIENIKTLEEAVKVHSALEVSQRKVLRLLSLPELNETEGRELAENIIAIGFWRAIDLDTGLIDSLIASGKIDIVRNQELQTALIRESTSNRTLNSQLDHFRRWYAGLQPNFLSIIGLTFDLKALKHVDATTVSGSRDVMAIAKLGDERKILESLELKSILSAMLATRSNFKTMLLSQLKRTRSTRELLTAELARS